MGDDNQDVSITVKRYVAESLWRCLKYYDFDKLGDRDEQALITAIEAAIPELQDKP